MPGRERLDAGRQPLDRKAGLPYQRGTAKGRVAKREEEAITPPPPCESCKSVLETSCELADAYTNLLSNAKALFMSDVVHHHDAEDRWLRLSRLLTLESSQVATGNPVAKAT